MRKRNVKKDEKYKEGEENEKGLSRGTDKIYINDEDEIIYKKEGKGKECRRKKWATGRRGKGGRGNRKKRRKMGRKNELRLL